MRRAANLIIKGLEKSTSAFHPTSEFQRYKVLEEWFRAIEYGKIIKPTNRLDWMPYIYTVSRVFLDYAFIISKKNLQ